jgi:hypothetical protein
LQFPVNLLPGRAVSGWLAFLVDQSRFFDPLRNVYPPVNDPLGRINSITLIITDLTSGRFVRLETVPQSPAGPTPTPGSP